MVGDAVRQGRPILEAKPFRPEVALAGPANRYRNALVRADLAWCLAIPIYPGQEEGDNDALPMAVLAVDSNVDVKYFGFDQAVVEALVEAAEALIVPVVESALELR